MFIGDRTIPYEAKQVHISNLKTIANYCENLTDCRRALQLNYFAEHFTKEQCLENHGTACDNCLKRDQFKVSNEPAPQALLVQ